MSIPASGPNHLPLPQWAYVPGETAEAEADYDTLAQAKLLVPARFRGYVPARHPVAISGNRRRSWKRYGLPHRRAVASGSCCAPVSRSPTPI